MFFGSPSWLGCWMHSGWMNAVGCAMHVALSSFGMFWVRVSLRPCLTSCWSNSSGTMLLWIQTLRMLRKQHILNNPLWWHWSRFNGNLPQPYRWINCWARTPKTVLSCPWSPMLGQFVQGIHISPAATAGSASSSETSSLPGAGCWHLWCALASVCPRGSCQNVSVMSVKSFGAATILTYGHGSIAWALQGAYVNYISLLCERCPQGQCGEQGPPAPLLRASQRGTWLLNKLR